MFGRLKRLTNLKTERNSNLGSAFNEGDGVIHGSKCTIPISTQKKLQCLGACVVMMERPASFLKKKISVVMIAHGYSLLVHPISNPNYNMRIVIIDLPCSCFVRTHLEAYCILNFVQSRICFVPLNTQPLCSLSRTKHDLTKRSLK